MAKILYLHLYRSNGYMNQKCAQDVDICIQQEELEEYFPFYGEYLPLELQQLFYQQTANNK